MDEIKVSCVESQVVSEVLGKFQNKYGKIMVKGTIAGDGA